LTADRTDPFLRGLASLLSEGDASMPSRIGPYRVISRIDSGATSDVFLCTTGDKSPAVAVKLVRDQDIATMLRTRFLLEREVLRELDDPAIVPIIEDGSMEDGRPWFAMPFVRGLPIDQWVDEAQPGITDLLHVFDAACAAVEYAHRKGVIHRDLKPSNILIENPFSGKPQPRLIDFGIARRNQQVGGSTLIGVPIGTPGFMSPEQAAGQSGDVTSDIWSLGALLRSLALQHTNHSVWQSEVTLVCARAQRPDPLERYGSVAELRQDLRRILQGKPVRASAVSVQRRIRLGFRRHPWLAGAAVLGAVLAAAAALNAFEARHAERIASAQILRTEDAMSAMLGALDQVPVTQRDAVVLIAMLDQAEAAYPLQMCNGPLNARMNLLIGELRHRVGQERLAIARLEAAWHALAEVGQLASATGIQARLWQVDAQMSARLHDGAKPMLEQALEDARRVLPPADPVRLQAESLASTNRFSDHPDQLVPWACEVAARMEEHAAPVRVRAAHAARTADLLERLHGPDALPDVEALRHTWSGVLDDGDPLMLSMDLTRSLMLPRANDPEGAADLLMRLQEPIARAYGERSHLACIVANNLGELLRQLHRDQEAIAALTVAAEGFRALYGPDNVLTRMAEGNLAEARGANQQSRSN